MVLVDKHDYHTFQPLLYQVATGLLEQPAVGHPIRDLFDKQENARVHQDEVTAIDLDWPRGSLCRARTAELRLPRAGARRRGQLLRRRGGGRARLPAVHPPGRRAPQGPRPGAVGGGRPQAQARGGWRAERRGGGRRSDRRRDRGGVGRALQRRLSQGLPGRRPGARADRARRGLAGDLRDVQGGHPRVHSATRSRSAGSRS